MRICLIASSRFPVGEPFHGGMEAHTALLAEHLMARGHRVSVFAAPGSDPRLHVEELATVPFEPSPAARRDVGAMPEVWMAEHHAYLGLMMELARTGKDRFDVIHNNSLHHLPIAMAELVDLPMVSTLHTPPVPWLESALMVARVPTTFVAVSRHTATAWEHAVAAEVVLNGIDTTRWSAGPGGARAVWTGRIVPEKAPHLAVLAALEAGMEIDLAGPRQDEDYFVREIQPLLGDRVHYAGHLDTAALVDLVGAAAVAVVSPVWDEPYGLVAAEAMACGTPVAAFRRGALPEIVTARTGALAAPGDVSALAVAIEEASRLDRSHVREHATRHLGVARMVSAYEDVYRRAAAGRAA
ncbi:glycosyltransferase [Aeromicrobium sp. SMF47]|uniref:Glycosyltransferase n=1 Tax=Aeromicrobium yanjiei TaxID=2662028 RepID=A0A5Q2MAZ6_9ACTN|nr:MULTISPECIES: glycosyltransferase [Aeromicrobium]MRJ75266.1 glycosyltransferase [Aeromicrobium yanjiei]MRK02676.1 glycosyltransferase [Aeromicrobium sp. S22]QGG40274.1 glycosyltransferase [Aeromicrobium yanjiei]